MSSYLPELLGLCDTIGVMRRGELVAVRPREQWSEPELLRFAVGKEPGAMIRQSCARILTKGGPVHRAYPGDRHLLGADRDPRRIFLTYHNFKIILTQTVIVSIGALGMTMIIVSGAIDLSVGSVVALTGVAAALLIQHGWGAVSTTLAAIASGGAVGLVNGAAVAVLRMPSFIITLGMLGIARGAAKWLADNQTVNYDTSPINGWMTTAHPFCACPSRGGLGGLALAAATSLLLRRTVFGRHIFALGSNEAAARLCGVPTVRLQVLVFSSRAASSALGGFSSSHACARGTHGRRGP